MESIAYRQPAAYSKIINQHGKGYDSDGYYIYSQDGEGIGSFLASLLRGALPIVGSAIKTAARAGAPHFKKGVKRAVAVGANDLVNSLAKKRRLKRRKI